MGNDKRSIRLREITILRSIRHRTNIPGVVRTVVVEHANHSESRRSVQKVYDQLQIFNVV